MSQLSAHCQRHLSRAHSNALPQKRLLDAFLSQFFRLPRHLQRRWRERRESQRPRSLSTSAETVLGLSRGSKGETRSVVVVVVSVVPVVVVPVCSCYSWRGPSARSGVGASPRPASLLKNYEPPSRETRDMEDWQAQISPENRQEVVKKLCVGCLFVLFLLQRNWVSSPLVSSP